MRVRLPPVASSSRVMTVWTMMVLQPKKKAVWRDAHEAIVIASNSTALPRNA
jgi:hypothetical protein